MNVQIVSSLFPRPDHPLLGIFVCRQVQAIREAGVDASVLCPIPDGPLGEGTAGVLHVDRWEGVPVRYVPYLKVPISVAPGLHARAIRRSVRRALQGQEPPDLVHAHWIFPTAWAVTSGGLPWRVPVVATARGSDIHTYPARTPGIRRGTLRALDQADEVTAVSEGLASAIRALQPGTRQVHVMYNGVDDRHFVPHPDPPLIRRTLGLDPRRRRWVCVARLSAAKGVLDLVEAFAPVAKDVPDLDLVFVGAGPDEEALRERSRALRISDRVLLVGAQPPDRVVAWLQAADGFVLASHREGLPNVVLEAMATGLPVVATDVGGTAEALEDQQTGLLVPPGSTESLSQALSRLALDPALCRTMGARGRERVQAVFSARACAARWTEFYERVIRRTSGLASHRIP